MDKPRALGLVALVTAFSGCAHLKEAVRSSLEYQQSIEIVATVSTATGIYEVFTDNTHTCRVDFTPRFDSNPVYFDREIFPTPFDTDPFYERDLLKENCPAGYQWE